MRFNMNTLKMRFIGTIVIVGALLLPTHSIAKNCGVGQDDVMVCLKQ